MAKHALGKKSFKPWTNFSWDDFVLLKELAKVFKTRHLPVSNAKAWASKSARKLLPKPKEWKSDVLIKTLSKNVLPTKRRRVPPAEEDNEVICLWDSDEGGLSGASPNKSPSASNPKPKKRIVGKKTKRKRKQVQRKQVQRKQVQRRRRK